MARATQWEGFPFWPSFTDIMVVTVMIFLFVLFSNMVLNKDALIAAEVLRRQNVIAEGVREALCDEKKYLTIVNDGNLQRFQFSDRILFLPAQAELLPTGRDVLGKVGEILRKKSLLFRTVQVEGHTDTRPIHTERFASNWELSSARATSVVRFLQDSVGLDPRLLSANGYAEYHPADPSNLDRNRRVELVLIYSTTDIETGAQK